MTQGLIETQSFASLMRSRSIDLVNGRILVARLTGSAQEIDLTEPANCGGYGRVRHFKQATAAGWPSNPLPIVPACHALGLNAPPEMNALVFQHSACAWRCWYCFVPENLLAGDSRHGEWLTANELVELYRRIPNGPRIIDLSGGSPDLVPEWTPWMMRALTDAGLAESTYLWGDDNLSTTYLFDNLSQADLDLVRSYRNYGRVCCIKGFDERSFSFNTQAEPDGFERQFEVLGRLLTLGIDLYGYATLTAPDDQGLERAIANLFDRLQALDPNFPLRMVPLRIQIYTPVADRLRRNPLREKSMEVQEAAIAAWNREIETRYTMTQRALPINEVLLQGSLK